MLARFELDCRDLEDDALQVLGSASSLTSLRIEGVASLAGLEAATQLRQLELVQDDFHDESFFEELPAALQRLHTLSLEYYVLYCVPRSVANLLCLQRLCLALRFPDMTNNVAAAPLPTGHWLASLRWLAAPREVLQASASVLHAATCLEHLSCLGLPQPGGADERSRARWDAFWSCLASLPALRCLCIHDSYYEKHPSPALSQALLELTCRQPELKQHLLQAPSAPEDLLTMADIPASLPSILLA